MNKQNQLSNLDNKKILSLGQDY